MNVSIVIPNRNGATLLQKNLPSVLAAAPGAEVIVVDDSSTDDSLGVLKKMFPSVKRIHKTGRHGFAGSVNIGVKEAKGEIVVLLNTDVRPEANFLSPLLPHFDDPSVFAVGCMEKSLEGGKTLLRGRGEAKWEKGFYIHWRGEVHQPTTAWVAGGSGAFRKSVWEKLGGMDAIYDPFYWEDIDLSYRARKAGYRILFEPTSVVVHEHEKGAIKQEYSELQVKTIAYRNQFLFIWKNLSDPRVLLAHAAWTPIRLLQAMVRGDFAMIVGYLWAIFRNVAK
ncbi:glycosyltransferase family 2 protein [Candidatus Gottesmanbacteria bacterium]|nr:glycosyltransferase family 2 protein [Candidatus Gottesmanbacteria bacterium]